MSRTKLSGSMARSEPIGRRPVGSTVGHVDGKIALFMDRRSSVGRTTAVPFADGGASSGEDSASRPDEFHQ